LLEADRVRTDFMTYWAFIQNKWHPVSSRWSKLQQTRLSNVKYAMDVTRHVKILQQILVLRQSRHAKWSVLWGE